MATALAASQFEIALRHHERGEFTLAERQYEAALVTEPDDPNLLQCAAVLALQMGKASLAVVRLSRCVELGGALPGTWLMLGRAQGTIGRHAAAAESYRTALEADPALVDAHVSLGVSLRKLGETDAAERAYRAAIALRPQSFEALLNLGNLRLQRGAVDEALSLYDRAASIRPDSADVHYNAGKALRDSGQHEASLPRFARAIECDTGFLDARYNFANTLSTLRRHADAIQVYEDLLQALDRDEGRLKDPDARAALRRDVEISLAAARIWCLRYDEAQPAIEDALRRNPRSMPLLEHALVILPYREQSGAAIEERYRQYQEELALRPAARPRFHADARGARSLPLRVGFVSGDFRDHSVAFFLEPFLAHHDVASVHVTCYSSNEKNDSVTSRLRAHSDAWRDVAAMPDDALADLIAADRIDVLVDLSGRTRGNRLGVFMLRPAPLQASYLGYPTYSGISEIDFRVTDRHIDPYEGRLHSERPLHLAESMFCYRPPADAPDVTVRSADAPVCFGSFNQSQKISPANIAAWASILDAVPDSRLLLKAYALSEPVHARRLLDAFTGLGVDVARIELRSGAGERNAHLSMYGEIDIALDTFPYNGATTTCEALWMGVPVVSLAGDTHAGRMGSSLLRTAGFHDLVAESVADYVGTAVRLAGDARRLRTLRHSVRAQVVASPLRDESRFARDFARTLLEAREAAPRLMTGGIA